MSRQLLQRLGDHPHELARQVMELELQIKTWHQENAASSKRGDTYLRTLLTHGARAIVRIACNKPDKDAWLGKLGRPYMSFGVIFFPSITGFQPAPI